MSQPTRGVINELFTLLKPFRLIVVGSILLGMLGGLSITALLATINDTLNAAVTPTFQMLMKFAGLCAAALLTSILSDIGTNHVGQNIIAELRKSLGKKVLLAPIEQIERFRSHRLIPVLTHDVNTVSSFAFSFAPLAIAFTVTLGCLGYLAYLSLPMFLLLLVALVIGTVVQYVARARGIRGFEDAREAEDALQKHYSAIAAGAKELRIHRPRRQRMFSQRIEATADYICDTNIRSVNTFVVAKTFGSMLFFVVIGLVLALQSLWLGTDKAVLSGFVLVLLYMKGPLEYLVMTLPVISRANIAFKRIAELAEQFSSPEPHLLLNDERVAKPTIQQLELRDVHYAFPAVDGSQAFALGPVNLSITQGDIVFIVGENGGGKTTLIKLLLGLYAPRAATSSSMASRCWRPNVTIIANCSRRFLPITTCSMNWSRAITKCLKMPTATWNAWKSPIRSASATVPSAPPTCPPANANAWRCSTPGWKNARCWCSMNGPLTRIRCSAAFSIPNCCRN